MTDTTSTQSNRRRRDCPPPPSFEPPYCPMCDEHTRVDDGYVICDPCGAQWDADSYEYPGAGGWTDPQQPQCSAELELRSPTSTRGPTRTWRCCMSQGHVTPQGWHVTSRGDVFFEEALR
ncbi:hypothetical protein GCM10025787_03340 [Saccharopolyspora rosea]|uniref:Uncharacterized protein n=1 Tax=Saccharopolyspora rosea TaxID=524884 RepID=A0ABW3FMB8_9PSEU